MFCMLTIDLAYGKISPVLVKSKIICATNYSYETDIWYRLSVVANAMVTMKGVALHWS